jgi:ATP-dependent DNA helicase RecQ
MDAPGLPWKWASAGTARSSRPRGLFRAGEAASCADGRVSAMRVGEAEPEGEAGTALQRHFGLSGFRTGQAEVIASVLAGRNTVVVMPTGAGKSLCYQLPAMLLSGVTLVVSPLIALMKDQVEQLLAKGISATLINSTISDVERAERIRRMREGAYRLVYVAPERFRSNAFVEALQATGVNLLAVDEAHCISQWGHDFRPDYALLGQVRKRLRPPRTVALTATATPEVRDDITRSLLLKDPAVFVAGFDRPNLFLEVCPVSSDDDKRAVCAARVAEGGSGLVYCATRKAAESMHSALKTRGHAPVLYHAGMEEEDRRRAQDRFMSGKDAVAIATNAFGMGIDKPDIRFVIHAHIPRAVEAYYQEIGRAGRDGLAATALLLFNHADVFTQERMIQGNHPSEAVIADVWNALVHAGGFERGLAALANGVGASEFEVSAALRILEREGLLERKDSSEAPWRLKPLTAEGPPAKLSKPARAVHEAVLALAPGAGVRSIRLAALASRAGLEEDSVRRALAALGKAGLLEVRRPFMGRSIQPLQRVPFHTLGLSLQRVRAQEARALLLLKRMTDYAYGRTCRRSFLLRYFGEERPESACPGCDVCRGKRTTLKLALSTPKARTAGRNAIYKNGGEAPSSQYNEQAALELRRFRTELSRDLEVPPFIVFNDKTLRALATALPRSREDFLAVKGTGPSSWERFGPKVLEICRGAEEAGRETGDEASR